MAATSFLRGARASRRLTQDHVARVAGTSVPNVSSIEAGRRIPRVDTLDRLLRATGSRLGVLPTTREGALEASIEIRAAIEGNDADAAFRAWLTYSDALAVESAVNRVVLAAHPPQPTGTDVYDAALAAVSEFRLQEVDAPIPDWVNDSPTCDPEVVLGDLATLPRDLLGDTPAAFLIRGLVIDRASLDPA